MRGWRPADQPPDGPVPTWTSCWRAHPARVALVAKRATSSHESSPSCSPTSFQPRSDRCVPGAETWLDSEPLTPEGLRGRVVLVDFWTYTCINWLRTLPYVRAWDAKYRDLGLTVISIHTPEFGFERSIDNVVAQSRTFGVEYPIAVDSAYAVWEAFANHFWPALYIADAEGRIRYHHFGEGEYSMAEMVVQQLLFEAGADDVDPDLVSVEPQGFEVAADWGSLRSPETYLGYGRSAGFVSPDSVRFNEAHTYPELSRLGRNQWATSGTWTLAQHAAVVDEAGGRIAFQVQEVRRGDADGAGGLAVQPPAHDHRRGAPQRRDLPGQLGCG